MFLHIVKFLQSDYFFKMAKTIGKDVEKSEPCTLLLGMHYWYRRCEKGMRVPQKIKTRITI